MQPENRAIAAQKKKEWYKGLSETQKRARNQKIIEQRKKRFEDLPVEQQKEKIRQRNLRERDRQRRRRALNRLQQGDS